MKLRKEVEMPKTVPFDTLAYAKKLEAKGVDVKQAEAHAEVLAEVLESTFTSKNDSESAVNSLAQEINLLRSEMNIKFADLKTEIALVKSEVIKWVFGISFAQAALIISVLKFFH
jgi:hypothetical protein